jgi:hypothetical protein
VIKFSLIDIDGNHERFVVVDLEPSSLRERLENIFEKKKVV